MNRGIYAIRDRVAADLVGMHMYMLMTFRTSQEAARYFADAVNDTSSILNKHPADYELVKLGDINNDGTINKHDEIVVITGDALLAVQQPALVQDAM